MMLHLWPAEQSRKNCHDTTIIEPHVQSDANMKSANWRRQNNLVTTQPPTNLHPPTTIGNMTINTDDQIASRNRITALQTHTPAIWQLILQFHTWHDQILAKWQTPHVQKTKLNECHQIRRKCKLQCADMPMCGQLNGYAGGNKQHVCKFQTPSFASAGMCTLMSTNGTGSAS